MDKICDLWVYRLVYEGETVGYRFQLPEYEGIFGDVGIGDKALIAKLKQLFNTKMFGNIPVELDDMGEMYVAPFDDYGIALGEENLDNFVNSAKSYVPWYKKCFSQLKDYEFIRMEDVKRFLAICNTCLEGNGTLESFSMEHSSFPYVRFEFAMWELLGLVRFINRYCEICQIESLDLNLNIGRKPYKGTLRTGDTFVREFSEMFFSGKPGSTYKTVDNVGRISGTFGCFGEVFGDYQTETFRLVVMFGGTTGRGGHAEKNNKIADWKWLTVD